MRRRVLMIDDDADIREVAALSLETMAGWETLQAATGPEGIVKAEQEKPDVILLDMMMPDMDGGQTLKGLKANQRTAEIPVLMLTAKTQMSEMEAMKRNGATGVLTKPFDPMTLCDEISEALGWNDEQ